LPTPIRSKDSPSLEDRVARLEEAVFGKGRKVVTKAATQKPSTLDYSGLTDVKRLKSFLDKSLCIMNSLSEKDPSSQGLTPDEIVSILGETFGVQTSLQVVSTQLIRAAGKYVARQKIVGKPIKYRYRILPEGRDRLKAKLSETRPAKETD
jgi:hypothetical protein